MKLFEHQKKALELTKQYDHVAYFHEMGLGKTFTGSEKMMSFGNKRNLIVCQKSKIRDWMEHLSTYYKDVMIINYPEMQKKLTVKDITMYAVVSKVIVIINYELLWRRTDLYKFAYDCCLMLDESSLIQNNKAKQTKFILSLRPRQVILLSGTPCSGKYENLWSQSKLLNFGMSKTEFEDRFVNWELLNVGMRYVRIPNRRCPYKNVEELKSEFRKHGAVFLKTNECFDLPEQTFKKVYVDQNRDYKLFKKNHVLEKEERTLVGDTTLGLRLGLRELCGMYSKEKLTAFDDLLASTNDRLIVFYNFNEELNKLKAIAKQHDKPISEVNGKTKDLSAYETDDNSITFCQYQAGSMGLNLQKANKVIYYTLPEKSDLFEQSKKRIHRIGQTNPCFYYIMLVDGSIEEVILRTLERREDFTNELFVEYMKSKKGEHE